MFVIENIREDDQLQRSRGETFLLVNPDPGVRMRPKDQLDLAIATGQGLLASKDGGICAISLVYQFDPGQGPVSYEIGTMRVTTEGYGLQVFLASLHLMQIWLEDDATLGDVFAVVSPNTGSAHNLEAKVGMADWTPPETLALLRASGGVPFAPGKRILRADNEVIRAAFARLRRWHIGGAEFETPKGRERIRLQLGWFDPSLLEHMR